MTVKSTNQRSESVPSRRSLRICCYGSSSSKTPSRYLTEAHELGSTLAKRGHICVNGAGPHGCMASLNDGASDAGGHIVGVIHKMFAIDGAGAHPVFSDKSKESVELIYAGGEDLQERKKLLVKGADALVVLPGGPGTWDELWEMTCARNIGITKLPIVCINVDGYYEPFRLMLERAHQDKLLYNQPDYLIHFEPTAEKAVKWIEEEVEKFKAGKRKISVLKRRESMGSILWDIGAAIGLESEDAFDENTRKKGLPILQNILIFSLGALIGGSLMLKRNTR